MLKKFLYLTLLAANAVAQPVIKAPQIVKIEQTDNAEDILRKAAQVRPHQRQLAYHQEEFIGFIHFGINTFTGREWGNGKENSVLFNPQGQVDTDQWCRVMKEAGMTKIMMTVKHHDGFCLWQTRYNDNFSVKTSPWKNGKGDVYRMLAQSAKKYGLKMGVYISPADLYQIESKDGLYGNLSKYQDSIIPTDPKSFKNNPLKQRETKEGLPSFKIKCDDYNRYMLNQLYEVLTEYGPIHEVWFDGAHPKRKGGQTYIKTEWFRLIRALQPQAVIFGGPDIRWCGNEHGGTRKSEWNILGVESLEVIGLDRPAERIGDDASLISGGYKVRSKSFKNNYLSYLISEVDTSIRHGWFWRNDSEQRVRDADEIFDIYERSVGTGTVLLLNVPPNKFGKFSERDVKCMQEVGARIRATYHIDLAAGASSTATNLFDDNIKTYWQAPALRASFEVELPQPRLINRIALQEAVSEVGQRVKAHAVDAWIDGQWKEISKATTIGYKRILRFPAVECKKLRVRITDSRALAPAIASFSAHYYAAPPCAVVMQRAADGKLILKPAVADSAIAIRYTLDGSEPSDQSPLYRKALSLPKGGWLKARVFVRGQAGPILERRLGLPKAGWKVSTSSAHGNHEAAKAIDGDPRTYWHSSWKQGHPVHPHTLTLELPKAETLTGLTYLPRQDRRVPDGMIEEGTIEVSLDGKNWSKAEDFTFGNLVNSPDERLKLFDKPLKARFVRLTSKKGAAGKPYAAAAEIGLLAE